MAFMSVPLVDFQNVLFNRIVKASLEFDHRAINGPVDNNCKAKLRTKILVNFNSDF